MTLSKSQTIGFFSCFFLFFQQSPEAKSNHKLEKGSIVLPFLNGPSSASFTFIFGLFKQTYKFYSKLMWKMSVLYPVPGFELTTFWLWVSSFNH